MKRIYIRTGDRGTTGIHGGERVEKNDVRIEANGIIDELNVVTGITRSLLPQTHDWQRLLHILQRELMVAMGHVATPSAICDKNLNNLSPHLATFCEQEMDVMTAELKENGYFLLPGDTPVSAQSQFARAVARRAERRPWTLNRQDVVPEETLSFINRLSDLFFVTARYDMQQQDWSEERRQSFAYKKKKKWEAYPKFCQSKANIMISKTPLDSVAKLNKICADAQIGWWEVNFNTGQCLIAGTPPKVLEVSSGLLSIDESMSIVRRDYRKRITDEFISIPQKGVFEQTFPVSSSYGNIFWMHCALSTEEENEEGQLIVTGYSQRMENPETEGYQCAQSQHSGKLFHDIFNNTLVGLELYSKKGVSLGYNNRNLEIFGVIDKNRIIGLSLFESPSVTQDILESLQTGCPGSFHLHYNFDEERRLFQPERKGMVDLDVRGLMLYDVEGNLSNYLLMNIDNTERNNAPSKVHDSEDFFSIISDYSKVGYAKISLLNHIGYAIRQWYRNLGESHDTPLTDIVGVFPYMRPGDRKLVFDFYEKAKAGTERFFDDDLCICRAEDSDEWSWIHKSSMVTSYQPPDPRLELAEVSYDITVQKETETKLRAARDKAEESNRLKSAFLANISHEARMSLNAIVGFFDLLMTVDDPAEQEELRQIMQKNNILLLQLFSDIIDLSKIDTGSFEYMPKPVYLYQFCAMMLQETKDRAPEGVELRIDEDLLLDAWFNIDNGYLNQVITNLVSNAIKSTHRGTITIGYQIDVARQSETFVEDTGTGISVENQTVVFDRFMKVNSFVQGTGLGLPLRKSIIEKIGGRTGVTSELGKDSRFWFTFPVSSRIPTR